MKEQIDKIKKHIKDHKEVYITGTVCFVVGSISYVIGKNKGFQSGSPTINIDIDGRTVAKNSCGGVLNRINTMTIHLEERSKASKPVHLVGTERYFASMHEAAQKTGHSVSDISKNANGLRPDVKGDVFELLLPTGDISGAYMAAA